MVEDKYPLMGKKVEVISELHRRTEDTCDYPYKVWWDVVDIPFTKIKKGWVVGYRHLQEGVVSILYGIDPQEYSPPTFHISKTIPCLLVTYHPRRNPIKVPLDGVVPVEDDS